MTKPSVLVEQCATGEELEQLYIESKFDALLLDCKQFTVESRHYPSGHPAHPNTIHKHGVKYRLGNLTVAVIFHYTHADRTVTRHIRMLRIGNTKFSVAKQAPVHPQIE